MLRKVEEEFETRVRDSEEYRMATIFKTIKFQIMFDFISRRGVSSIDTRIMLVLVFEVSLSSLYNLAAFIWHLAASRCAYFPTRHGKALRTESQRRKREKSADKIATISNAVTRSPVRRTPLSKRRRES